jgi:hypothetical protein
MDEQPLSVRPVLHLEQAVYSLWKACFSCDCRHSRAIADSLI